MPLSPNLITAWKNITSTHGYYPEHRGFSTDWMGWVYFMLQNIPLSCMQQAYADRIIKHFNLKDACTATMPMEHSANFTPNSPSVSPILLLIDWTQGFP